MICIKGLQCVQQRHIQNIFSTSKTEKKDSLSKNLADASYRVIGGSVRVTLALTTIHQLIINGAPYHRAPGFLCSEVRGCERSTCASNDTGNDEKYHEKSTNAVTSSKLTNNLMDSSVYLKIF